MILETFPIILATFGLSGTALAVLGAGALGAGASVYGANKQSKATQDAASKNNQSQAAQNAAAWSNYLMTRGINPAGAQTGQIPQGAQSINARLPLWATVRRNVTPQGAVSLRSSAYPSATGNWRKPIGFQNGQLIYDEQSTAPGVAPIPGGRPALPIQ